MGRWGHWLLVGALGVGLLLGFPPFLHFVLKQALPLLGFSGTVQSVRGHLLLGLRLEGVDLASPDLRLKAKRLWVFYDLLGLFRKELPLSLRLEGARLEPRWEALIPEAKAPPPPVRLVFRSLVLKEVEVSLPQGQRLHLPPLRLTLSGENPYRFLARLPGGSLEGEAKALDRELSSFEVRYRGELRALSFYYPELLGGRAEGVWRVGPSGVVGENRLRGGRLRLVGFEISEVEGPVAFKDDRVLARLKGVGLQGPVEAQAEVDLKGSWYRFWVRARPSLPAFARHYRLALPLEGQGALRLEGRGWERLHLEGDYEGRGRFLGQPLRLSGSLGFDGVFWLKGTAESQYLDRAYRVGVDLRGGRYRAHFQDTLGSRLELLGEGVRTEAQGEVVWPRPLLGRGRVFFQSQGDAWEARVESPQVALNLTRGLDLSGSLKGKGSRVEGQLGPVGFSGRWDDLRLTLAPTPLLVGRVEGEGGLKEGRLEARLQYTSPYAAFPLRLWQEGGSFFLKVWEGEQVLASGAYQGGAFRLDLKGLPVQAGDRFLLFGQAVYRGGLAGKLRVEGRYARALLDLYTFGARVQGEVQTPLGPLPFAGRVDEGGLRLSSPGPGGLRLTYRPPEGLRLLGKVALSRGFGPKDQALRLEADFAYREGFSGWARLVYPPYQSLFLLGEGDRILAEAQGLLEGKGEVYPGLRLSGRVDWGRLPLSADRGLDLPPLAFTLEGKALRVFSESRQVGEVGLNGRFSFQIPGRYRGVGFVLEASGDLGGGQVRLALPDEEGGQSNRGLLEGKGPWRALALSGRLNLPHLGQGRVSGSLDLLALRYQVWTVFKNPEGARLQLALRGEGARLRFAFTGLMGRAWGAGFYDGGRLRYSAFFNEADLAPFGLSLALSGRLGDSGGRLKVSSPYGQAFLEGEGPLSASLALETPYAFGKGRVDQEGAKLSLELRPPFSGSLLLEGPWKALRLEGQGELSSPVGPLPFTLRGGLEGGQFRYRLEGPLRLSGEGASYQGVLDLPFEALGQKGRFQGEFSGEGGRFQAQGEGVWAGVGFGVFLKGAGLDPASWQGRLSLLGGRAVLEEGRLHLDLGLEPLSQALGQPIQGRIRGALDLKGMGEVQGEGKAFGEAFHLRYQDRRIEVFLPDRRLGVGLDERGLWGLGGLEGRVDFHPFGGQLSYDAFSLILSGKPLRPEGVLTFPDGRLSFQADLSQALARGQLIYRAPWAEGEMGLVYRKGALEGQGRLRTLAYLKQEGPLRLKGEGERVQLSWEAPLRVVLAYDRALAQELSFLGEGLVELGGQRVRLKADLSYAPSSGYRGGFQAEGYGILLKGLDKGDGSLGLALEGEGLRGGGRLEGGVLALDLSYARALGKARLEALARVSGELKGLKPDFRLEGQGVLAGASRREAFRFAYDGAPWFSAPGLGILLQGETLKVELDQDLTEFGLPLRLRLKGEGPWREAVLSAELLHEGGVLRGEVFPAGMKAALSGEVFGERVVARYEGGLFLRFLGPRLLGEASYRGGLSGRVGLDLPLPQGGLKGGVDLGGGLASLKGYGAWAGRVAASWCFLQESCDQGRLDLKADLSWREYRLLGQWRYEGEVRGAGQVETPYGQVRLLGRGQGLDLSGEGLPLSGRLSLSPFSFSYRYAGPLPQGLGGLEAEGRYPGAWLKGTYQGYGKTLRLEGLEGFRLALRGEGVEGSLGPDGVFLHLEGFTLGPLRLSGKAEGPWNRTVLSLRAEAFGRLARLEGVWDGGLEGQFSGDLEGKVTYRNGWSGEVRVGSYGRLAFSGQGLPILEGELLDLPVRFAYPEAFLSGLRVDLARRWAEGRVALFGVEAEGVEEAVRFFYPPLEAQALLSLKDLSLRAWTGLGEGALEYKEGRVQGEHTLVLGPLFLRLEGVGDGVALFGKVEATDWWPEEVQLTGKVGLDLAYSLRLQTGEEVVEGVGQGGSFRLSLSGPYGKGVIAWPVSSKRQEDTGSLALDLPLRPLESRLRLVLWPRPNTDGPQGDLAFEAVLEGGVGRVEASGRLWPLEVRARLEEARLEDFMARYAPYLKGIASGELFYRKDQLSLDLKGEAQVGKVQLPFALVGGGSLGALEGEGQLGGSRFQLSYQSGVLRGVGRTQAFPLHALLGAVAGPLEGEAYWTGAFRFLLPKDPWQAQGVLVGEYLRFVGGGDELSGRAALRFEKGRLSVDELALSGKGTWRGGGYWSREGAELWLSLKDTVFTPVLKVVPALRPYAPEGSGSVEFRLGKQNGAEALSIFMKDFRFKLGPVEGYLPQGSLLLNGGARAEGEITLLKPFPGKGSLGLEGDLKSFALSARGRLAVPGLREEEPFLLAFRYPSYALEVRYANALAQGTVYPLRMAAYGSLPVRFPQHYLLDGLLNIRSAFLYEEKGVYHLTGDLEVQRARLGLPEGEKEVALPAKGEGGGGQVPLVFEGLRIRADRGAVIQEALAQGELFGEAYLQGTYQDPYLTGEVRALWGNFRLWDQLFVLNPQASYARFTPQGGLLPELRLVAQSEVRGYTVRLEAEGRFVRENGRVRLRLDPRFTSDPPLDTLQIYALLTLGTTDVTRLGETVPQTVLGAAFQTFLLGQLERELSRALGLDRFQVETPVFQGGRLEETRFTLGKYLTPELFLGYQVDLRGTQAVAAEYRRDGFSLTFSTTLSDKPRTLLGLGYSLTPSLDLLLNLESDGASRFSIGLSYRF